MRSEWNHNKLNRFSTLLTDSAQTASSLSIARKSSAPGRKKSSGHIAKLFVFSITYFLFAIIFNIYSFKTRPNSKLLSTIALTLASESEFRVEVPIKTPSWDDLKWKLSASVENIRPREGLAMSINLWKLFVWIFPINKNWKTMVKQRKAPQVTGQC